MLMKLSTKHSYVRLSGYDVVQCVPTKKGHQILYKGYTYVFKCRLQCGSEQWCCSYRQKTEQEDEELPDWVTIYFLKNTDTEYTCNLCEEKIQTSEKAHELTQHIKEHHRDVYNIHKGNPEAMVGFRVEFLHVDNVNMLKGDEVDKNQPIILGELCEATSEEIVPLQTKEGEENIDNLIVRKKPKKQTKKKMGFDDNRKRSWVWRYFHRMSDIIYRCTLCNVVLSIKGCNTNNMNRHIRSRHTSIFNSETENKKKVVNVVAPADLDMTEVETPFAIKTEEITASTEKSDLDESYELTSSGHRRSWIWLYFDRKSATAAQCKLCSRTICHGGNATGNMNRHLKIIHNKTADIPDHIYGPFDSAPAASIPVDNAVLTRVRNVSTRETDFAVQNLAAMEIVIENPDEYTWIWKVFESADSEHYTCKICQYRTPKLPDADRTISTILDHLKIEHGVVSGDQIITSMEDGEEITN